MENDAHFIYYIFVLKEYLPQVLGTHYPTEIIGLIIMSIYNPIKIFCGFSKTILLKNKVYEWGSVEHEYSENLNLCKDIKSIILGHHVVVISNILCTLYVWGKNRCGQLGLGNCIDQSSPQELILCSEINSVDCGYNYTIALLKSGKLYSWGRNTYGQLGLGENNMIRSSPQEINLTSVIEISCGDDHVIALTKFHKCYTWGKNTKGQLGLGHNICDHNYFPQELELSDIISISCGRNYTIALTLYRYIYIWGSNCLGQLGLGDNRNRNFPKKLGLTDIVSVNCGNYHTICLEKSGHLYVWGCNGDGQLGLGHCDNMNIPQKLVLHNQLDRSVRSIYCGGYHTILVTRTDAIYGWGWNTSRQLGLEDRENKYYPTKLI